MGEAVDLQLSQVGEGQTGHVIVDDAARGQSPEDVGGLGLEEVGGRQGLSFEPLVAPTSPTRASTMREASTTITRPRPALHAPPPRSAPSSAAAPGSAAASAKIAAFLLRPAIRSNSPRTKRLSDVLPGRPGPSTRRGPRRGHLGPGRPFPAPILHADWVHAELPRHAQPRPAAISPARDPRRRPPARCPAAGAAGTSSGTRTGRPGSARASPLGGRGLPHRC